MAPARGKTQSEPWAKEGVAKVHLILINACRSAQPFAHKLCFINDLYGRTAVRPYTRNLGQPTFATPSLAHGPAWN